LIIEMKMPLTSLSLAAGLLLGLAGSIQAQDVAEVKISADKLQLIFDIKEFTVKAGQTVKLTLVNPADSMNLQPHNLLIVKPGKLNTMIAVVNDPKNFTNPNWIANPIPESDDLLHHTKLLKPGESETIEFTAPAEPGDYPYLCSYIGHAAIMNGVMKVTK
jgi:azurin